MYAAEILATALIQNATVPTKVINGSADPKPVMTWQPAAASQRP